MSVQVPRYDRARLTAGIVHIGLGNFHRAHMAVYLDDLFNLGGSLNWAILGAGVKPADSKMRTALLAQDCLSTVIELDPAGKRARRVGSMIGFVEVAEHNQPLIVAMSRADIRIVSLTVTEGGYFMNPATGHFDPAAPEIVADTRDPDRPGTAFGAIIAGLKARREAERVPFTVLSCDNLPGNGNVARAAVVGLARLSDPTLADWIERNVAFPNSMVDRITPATSSRELAMAVEFGFDERSGTSHLRTIPPMGSRRQLSRRASCFRTGWRDFLFRGTRLRDDEDQDTERRPCNHRLSGKLAGY